MALRAIVGTSVPTAAYRASALHDSCATNRTAWLRAPRPGLVGSAALPWLRSRPGRALLAPDPLLCAALPPSGRLFARSASALAPGPLPPRASAPGRAARRLSRPLRPGPPAPPLGRLCAAPRLRGLSLAALPPGVAVAPVRPPCSVGLPPAPASLRFSARSPPGPPGPLPLRGFGGFPRPPASALGSRPGACAALRAACFGLRPPGSPARAGLPALASSGGGSSGGGFFRPLPSPSGGARSLRRLRPRGGSRFSRPSPRVPRAASRPPVRPPGLG